jgi:hypothetical protein
MISAYEKGPGTQTPSEVPHCSANALIRDSLFNLNGAILYPPFELRYEVSIVSVSVLDYLVGDLIIQ